MAKISTIAAAVVLALVLAVAGFFALRSDNRSACSGGGGVAAAGQADIGGPFTLIDQFGETVTDKDVITGPTLIYFGYTSCTDICPLDVARNVDAIDQMAAKGYHVKPVFVSIDPERDTPEVLRDYAEAMHGDMIALTGTPAQVKAASRAYRTYYRKNGEGADYEMDHSTYTYLMSPKGFLDFFRRDATPEELAKTVECYIDAG